MVRKSDSRRRRSRRIAAPHVPVPVRAPHLSRSARWPFTRGPLRRQHAGSHQYSLRPQRNRTPRRRRARPTRARRRARQIRGEVPVPDPADLDGFCWLATSRTEPAGPLERRTWLGLLNTALVEVDTFGLFRSTYPAPVEDALFVLLLILFRRPREIPWQPFRIPGRSLHRRPVLGPNRAAPIRHRCHVKSWETNSTSFEVPDQSDVFEFGTRQHDALQQRWSDLVTVLARADTAGANFHPLTRHFFVKALSEHGVDEIISNLSCLEATLQLKHDRSRNALKQRYTRLVANDEAASWLTAAYELRDGYLHSLADPKHGLTSTDLAGARWTVAAAVKKYLDFAIQRPALNRSELLKRLEREDDG